MNDTTGNIEKAPKEYSKLAIILHWLMAFLLIAMLLTGEQTMGNHDARFLPTVHASLGIILFVLVSIRLLWRLIRRHPEPISPDPFNRFLSRFVHMSLYIAMFLIPLTGWLAYTEHVKRSFGIHPASWFGYKIPLLPDLGINWHLIHNWGGKLFLLLILLHILAGLKHHFVDRDQTLLRILK